MNSFGGGTNQNDGESRDGAVLYASEIIKGLSLKDF